jgi:hypothetical protein
VFEKVLPTHPTQEFAKPNFENTEMYRELFSEKLQNFLEKLSKTNIW